MRDSTIGENDLNLKITIWDYLIDLELFFIFGVGQQQSVICNCSAINDYFRILTSFFFIIIILFF